MASILVNDTELQFPNFTIVSASAGSGKTHTLTLKMLQLLLSPLVPNNRLCNVLAMTFTKNAAAEMRQRVLEYLKRAYLGQSSILDQLRPLVSMDEPGLRSRCGELIETILQDYSAFQVQTIDSFMARVFRASALDFGFSPVLETILNNRIILDAAFEQFSRELAADPSKQQLLEELTDILVESRNTSSRFIWNPYQKLSNEVRSLYDTLNAQSKDVLFAVEDKRQIAALRSEILETFHRLHRLVRESTLEMTRYFENAAAVARAGDVDKLLESKSIGKPVKAGRTKAEKEKFEAWTLQAAPIQKQFDALSAEYSTLQAYQYYLPYVKAHYLFQESIEQVMRRNGQVHLSHMYRKLLAFISETIVPQVFFYLGDTVFHYLIDEFQDTAPVQWEALKPLLAEALSKQGSVFLVGDTKQSIYAFRSADWRIMKNLMETVVFPSAPPDVRALGINYRSFEQILEFDKTVFQSIVPKAVQSDASDASGLATFRQEVDKKNRKKGYVEVISFEDDKDLEQSRAKMVEIIAACHARGYRYADITILTPKNEHVVTISEWLNSASIKFISHSSLDIRGRSITCELIALLRFLDSPIDDLAFTTVLLGSMLQRLLAADGRALTREAVHTFLLNARREKPAVPLYASFRLQYADIWTRYFDELFAVVGYLPMYDLLSEIYKRFRLFDIAREEEGTLAKLLEVMKNFEDAGQNNLKDFLSYAEDDSDDADWNIDVPAGADAVSVMTIHKAKGLDNRVIIVLLADSRPRAENLFIEETPDGVRLVHITQKNSAADPALQKFYDQYKLDRAVDDLNKLYVAFTRAKEEMYVLSVKSATADEPSKFLPSSGFEPSVKPKVVPHEHPGEPVATVFYSSMREPVSSLASEKLALYERRRGDAMHGVLSRIEFADAKTEILIDSSLQEIAGSWMEPADALRMKSSIMEFLRLPEIAPFFAPGEQRIVMNEQEFVSPEGRLFRMDRIVMDPDTVTVLDFKSGDDKGEYTDQVQGYVAILQNFYPGRAVQGVLAFVDGKKLRVVA